MNRRTYFSFNPYGFHHIFTPTDEQLDIRDRILCCGFPLETACRIIAIFQTICDLIVAVACIIGLILCFSINFKSYFMEEWYLSEEHAEEAKLCKRN